MTKHGFLKKYSKRVVLNSFFSHEINQFCSKHTLQEVYISLFDTLDDDLVAALQRDCDRWAPGIESKEKLLKN